jgi:phage shock protein A
MGIFSRLFKIGQAKANKVIDGMEDPEIMLEQAIRDREKEIGEAKQSVQQVIASERRTKALLDQELENQKVWEQKAETALKASDEELATKALMRSEEHEAKAATLKPQWENQRKEVEELKESVKVMEADLDKLKRDKNVIVAQHKTAEVKKQIFEAKAKIGTNKTSELIERMKEKAQKSTFEAQAAEEMAQDSAGEKLEKQFEKLEAAQASAAVKERLAAMKQNMSKS